MREILFRGKRVDNEEWVEGIYYPVKYSGFSIPGGIDYYIITCFSGGGKSQIQVIPETVGQFTGLTDKNGAKIFEGDIIKHPKRLFEVFFDDELAGFYPFYDADNGYGWGVFCNEREVIDNIHDAPELLEKSNET